ncbi:hypothetical protein PK35_01525 [Tamlana nanhaiensis]|uniref:Porin n=1 Tax=Neotamlana nanhaiensis TaxID=1382798 RepID=A0A0D7W6R2_9FLAO|nr:hypothetical protein PK35_01525 [Tamlana nanhaiensis]
MKKSIVLVAILLGTTLLAQTRDLDNYRLPDQRDINVFEAPKTSETTFDGVKVRIGGASTLQYQALDHENSGDTPLAGIGANFNLATANLDLDVVLADGVRMHLRTYLSSRHHPEPYVKGGYFQIDKLDFISEGFLEDLMKNVTIKVGHMENNYGDAHFRRSDNAQTMYNPFVGNLIMDAFTTEVGGEVYYRNDKGILVMLGIANGKLNQSTEKSAYGNTGGASFLAKLGYDKQFTDDFRFRLTGSLYNTGYVPNSYLYAADRTGSRYYHVLQAESATSDNFRSGRYNPAFGNKVTAIMINPFVKYKGLEFFGTYENTSGNAVGAEKRTATQYAGEVIYRFGKNENFFIGGRYNVVDGEEASGDDITIKRTQLGAGWFMTKNILMKAEYVNQTYDGFATGGLYDDAKFNGLMLEAAISF